jgi:predicted RNA binding protein YcfA (HicA-like mRNA interferase family)
MAVLLAVLSADTARGDMGPSFLKNETFPVLRFDNLADYPDFDFYLLYGRGTGNPINPHLTRTQSGEPIREFEGEGRIGPTVLLAVPRGQQPPSPKEQEEWFREAPPGCLQSTSLDGVHAGAGYLVSYSVRVQDGRLEVTRLATEWLPGPWLLRWFPCFVVPLAACLAAAWLGVRLARRPPWQTRTGSPQPDFTYGVLDKRLRDLGFAAHTQKGKARVYKHELTGATVILPDAPFTTQVLPHHLVVVRRVLSEYDLGDLRADGFSTRR